MIEFAFLFDNCCKLVSFIDQLVPSYSRNDASTYNFDLSKWSKFTFEQTRTNFINKRLLDTLTVGLPSISHNFHK